MITILLKLFWMIVPLAMGAIWYFLSYMFWYRGKEQLWEEMCKVGIDKMWHNKFLFWLMAYLIYLDLILDLWSWIAITIAEAVAIGKEVYDRYWGKEKKFDFGDLLGDEIGIIEAWFYAQLIINAMLFIGYRR